MKPVIVKCILILLLILIYHTSFAALQNDQKIIFSADRIEIDTKNHKGYYTGHIRLVQGKTTLKADSAETIMDNAQKLIYAKVNGSKTIQVHATLYPKPNAPKMEAFADHMEFFPAKNLLILQGNAALQQNDQHFLAPKIEIDTKSQRLVSISEGNQKTTIIIHRDKLP